MSRVEELLARKRRDVQLRKKPIEVPSDDRRVRWSKYHFHVIAELKRASPSAGTIRPDLDIPSLAKAYERAGVSAISVLTEEHYFRGSLEDLRAARKAVNAPLLQKDFIVDEFQILEAKAAGADFVLLIVHFLTREQLKAFLKLCEEIRINALVEIRDESDIAKLDGPVEFLGVNSRNLETLEIDTGKFERLRNELPECFWIAESGITSIHLLARLADLGYRGALIGEHFLRKEDPAAEATQMVGLIRKMEQTLRSHACGVPQCQVTTAYKPLVKICGITREKDALLAIEAGAHALGFIFAESARRIDPETLLRFRHRIPGYILCVGVFRGQTKDQVRHLMQQLSMDIAQMYDPIRLNVLTWNAFVITGISDIARIRDRAGRKKVLWDIKLKNPARVNAWKKIGQKKVFVLAGDLDPNNVAQAISICRPEWVDVARGVEKAPGIKDPAKMRDFLKAVQAFRMSYYKLGAKS